MVCRLIYYKQEANCKLVIALAMMQNLDLSVKTIQIILVSFIKGCVGNGDGL